MLTHAYSRLFAKSDKVRKVGKKGVKVVQKGNKKQSIFDHFSHFYPFTLSISEKGSKSGKFLYHLLMLFVYFRRIRRRGTGFGDTVEL